MATYYPSSVISAISDYTAWTTTGNLVADDFSQVRSVSKLSSVALSLAGSTSSTDNNPTTIALTNDHGIFFSRTAPLIVSGFGINHTSTVNGIEVTIHSQRGSRVVDWDISLWDGAKKIGTNQAEDYTVRNDHDQPKIPNNSQTYGSSTSSWGTTLTAQLINDPGFGISIEMSSHPLTPHADTVYIDSVSLTVY